VPVKTGGVFDGTRQEHILAALKAHGGPMRSSELQAAVQTPNAPTLNRWITPLLGKRVVRTGHARGVRYALKEGL
jgi:hypothetical protein